MSTKAYIGINGSGKSYEVCSVVIFNALKQGRRVVSNIAGLDYAVYKRLLNDEGIPDECIGSIVSITHDQPLDPLFWLTDDDRRQGVVAFIQPGDLLVLDEIWRFWGGFGLRDEQGKKKPERVTNFFRMHRQFTHKDSGISCDIILISQLIDDFHRSVKGLVDQTYSMTKLVDVGRPNQYRIDIFSKARIVKTPLRQMFGTYDPKFFDLYKSHSQKEAGGADARELVTDTRGNIFKGGLFRVFLPASLVLLLVCGVGLWRFFHPKSLESENAISSSAAVSTESVGAVSAASRQQSEISDAWRVTGHYQRDASINIAIQDSAGNIRVLNNPPNYKISALGVEVELPEGGFATSWTALSASGRGVMPR